MYRNLNANTNKLETEMKSINDKYIKETTSLKALIQKAMEDKKESEQEKVELLQKNNLLKIASMTSQSKGETGHAINMNAKHTELNENKEDEVYEEFDDNPEQPSEENQEIYEEEVQNNEEEVQEEQSVDEIVAKPNKVQSSLPSIFGKKEEIVHHQIKEEIVQHEIKEENNLLNNAKQEIVHKNKEDNDK